MQSDVVGQFTSKIPSGRAYAVRAGISVGPSTAEAAPLFFATAVPPGVLRESRTIEEGGRARVASDGDEKRVLVQEHPDTLISMNNLAFMWKALRRDNEALELIENPLQLRKQRLGPDHSGTISSLEALNEWQMENLALGS